MALDYLRNNYQLSEKLAAAPKPTKSPNTGASNIFKAGVLAILIAVTLVFSYKLWKPALKTAFGSNLGFSSLKVTGIMSDNEDPMAVVGGKVVHEGDVIGGYTVYNIEKDSVTFSKNGKTCCRKLSPKSPQVNN